MKGRKKITLFDACNVIFMLLILAIILYPLYFTVIASFSEPIAVALGEVKFLPAGFTLDAYRHVLEYKQIWVGYKNTIIYTVFGTLYSIVLTIPAAYMLSKKHLPGRNTIMTLFMITMYFSGGIVPTYLLIKNMGLLDTKLIMIISSGVSVYNLIVAKTYFSSSISGTLYEAAEIDGASIWKKIWYIDIPTLLPTAMMVFILDCGKVLSSNTTKALVLQTAGNVSTSDIIGVYTYNIGLGGGQRGGNVQQQVGAVFAEALNDSGIVFVGVGTPGNFDPAAGLIRRGPLFLCGIGAVAAMDGNAVAAGDKSNDFIAGDRRAALGEFDQTVVQTLYNDTLFALDFFDSLNAGFFPGLLGRIGGLCQQLLLLMLLVQTDDFALHTADGLLGGETAVTDGGIHILQ